MLKKIAILALAVSLTLIIGSSQAAPFDTQSQANTVTPKRSASATHAKRSASAGTTTKVQARRTRGRRYRAYNPWHISSFGEPANGDDPAGDDPNVRRAALEALGNWNGSVVVVDPNSGRVLTIVNQKLALSSGFTPCSTFKPVVALAALKEDVITPTTKLRVAGRQRIALTEALAKSNNNFFSKLGEMLGFERLSKYAHEFGLGQQAGWNIPGESPGRFPRVPPKEGGVGYLAYDGQDIEVTPLQMAALISGIANGGTLYELQYPRTPEELAQFTPRVRRRLDDLAQYIPQIKDGLAAAVIYGTARSAFDPQMQILGKTGTCSEDGARLGWFVSYGGDLHPKYVVVVLLRGGRMMYGPHAAEIAGRLYHELLLHEPERGTQASSDLQSSPARAQR